MMATHVPDYDLGQCTLLSTTIAEENHVTFNLYHPVFVAALTRRVSGNGGFGSNSAPSEGLLRRAYCAVCFRHPILRARRDAVRHRDVLAIPSDDFCAAGTMEELSSLPVFVHRVDGGKETAWKSAVEMSQNTVWDSTYVFQVDAFVFEPEERGRESQGERGDDICRAVLVAHMNHGVGDGIAFTVAMADFVRALNCCGPSGLLPPVGCLGSPRPIPKLSLERFPNFSITGKDGVVSDDERAGMVDKALECLRKNAPRFTTHVHEARLTEEQSARFISACKSHGVTVTAGIYAAMLVSIGAHSVASVMPFSMRTKDEAEDISSCCRIMPVVVPELDAGAIERKDVWKIAATLGKRIAALRGEVDAAYEVPWMGIINVALLDPLVTEGGACGMFSPGADAASEKRTGTFLSNLGVVDHIFASQCSAADGGTWSVEDLALFCVNKVTVTDSGAWCLTYRNRIHIAFMDTAPPHDKGAFEAYAKGTVELMTSVA